MDNKNEVLSGVYLTWGMLDENRDPIEFEGEIVHYKNIGIISLPADMDQRKKKVQEIIENVYSNIVLKIHHSKNFEKIRIWNIEEKVIKDKPIPNFPYAFFEGRTVEVFNWNTFDVYFSPYIMKESMKDYRFLNINIYVYRYQLDKEMNIYGKLNKFIEDLFSNPLPTLENMFSTKEE